ncbi:adenosylcobinamide-phosphate synthase CbiB [Sedimentitalea sp. JM2-8]|uniref:Cobalamin biosynthesis protein CobD n=1 Tax=Sedimentitalea xiamensis TaxID=3050037 RepID=A0ABT7FAD9_9RHOB|nr:adenosylcobinamide-phosphate synthase CbiB [Sedimentitalea xiamensis]MDK3072069.1 adenosylcobinamide-phosphate synthase CbiB [Sedimentitalea xiamensis]
MTDGALLVAAALLLDGLFGEPRWLWSRLPHPAVLMGRAVGALDRVFNAPPARRAKGVLAVLLLSGGAILAGWLLSLGGPVIEIATAAILLAQRSLVEHVAAVAAALRLSADDARAAVAMIVSRDCRDMTQAEVARAAIESASENLSDGVIAPAFWFLVAGLPGLVLYKAINTADSTIGYRTPRHEAFGWAAARSDDLLNLIPARLTGLMIAALAGQLRAWPEIVRDARRHRSPNAGWPEAAMARALDLALAGPRSYDGQLRQLAWVNGGARREIGADDIDAAVAMLWRVWGLSLVMLLAGAATGFLLMV